MTSSSQLSFPDEPRAELDLTLQELVGRASDVLRTQGRLRSLLGASQTVAAPLELPLVLHRVVEAAAALVDAAYGALGVVGPDGALEEFIHVGVAPEVVERIGHLPEGRGMLGALIEDPRPLRLSHLSEDPRSVGFPAGHPPMDSFLGVPVKVHDVVIGNLYLTNKRDGEFTAEDEQLVIALATTAGFAIENARLYAMALAREYWAGAAAQIAAAVAASPTSATMATLADELIQMRAGDRVCILVADEEPLTLRVAEVRGIGPPELIETTVSSTQSLAGVVLEDGHTCERAGEPVPGEDADALAIIDEGGSGPTLFAPLRLPDRSPGVLALSRRPGAPRFTRTELDTVTDFTSRIGMAVEIAEAREDQQRVALLEDRARIARDLHDHVIQELFATGLELQSLAALATHRDMARRLESAVTTLDRSIVHVRTIIFSLSARRTGTVSARRRIADLVDEISRPLPRPVEMTFSGPIDLVVTGNATEDLVAAVREMLSNAVRHASAATIQLEVTAQHDGVCATVTDDGIGIPDGGRRSGLENLRERAQSHGGSFGVATSAQGTRVAWQIPLHMPEAP